MRSTLFYIPHQILGVPLLGVGWLLLLIVIGFFGWALMQYRKGRLKHEFWAGLPMWLGAAVLVMLVLPQVESRWPNGQPIGLPVRGYGVLVLLGLFSGIGLTIWRGSQLNISPDQIISLGFWMMMGGVLGARIFFVVQYWDDSFAGLPFFRRIVAMAALTEGGLVIYGGMIGGVIAGAIFCQKWRLPMLAFADLITPGFLIGLAFGRIGCLMNGCCFGGVCEAKLPTIRFPQGSPPYVAQVENGRLFGLKVSNQDSQSPIVTAVAPGSIAAEKFSAEPGMDYHADEELIVEPDANDPARTPSLAASIRIGPSTITLGPNALPPWSLPVHPSQIYSAIDALLLCILIVCLQPWVRRDGQAFLTAVALHGVARFILELIRSDEPGQFGTSLTIAQWISILGGATAAGFWIFSMRLPPKRAWAWPR